MDYPIPFPRKDSGEKHNTPRRGDAVYITGHWRQDVVFNKNVKGIVEYRKTWIKSSHSRVNGTIVYVNRELEEANVSFKDHKYADKDEPKVMRLGFSVFYGHWNAAMECFVLTDDLIS